MVRLVLLPLKPVKILFPGVGTVGVSASAGALAQADSIAPFQIPAPGPNTVAVPFTDVKVVEAVVLLAAGAKFNTWSCFVQ